MQISKFCIIHNHNSYRKQLHPKDNMKGKTENDTGVDVKYKVSILGESGVGKTAILRSVTGQPFVNHMVPTIGKNCI